MNNWNVVIDKFNESNKIRDVIETCTGIQIKGKSLCCPIHGGDNKTGSSIDEGKNIFTCWTSDCGRGLSPWWFIKKYYGFDNNKEVAEKVNQLFNANIPIYEKRYKAQEYNANKFDENIFVDNHLSECNAALRNILNQHKHILLNANTGLGKTYGIVELNKNTPYDYVFILVSTRSLAEDVANEYGYELFYDNETELPTSKYIVSTFKKINAINRALDNINSYRAMQHELLVTYSVIVDEVHELMSKRNLTGGSSCRAIESFILNADESIMMSANTDSVYDAYRDTELFNKYISVVSRNRQYNSDITHVYRIPRKEKQRKALLLNAIIENITTHSKILLMEDSKKNLEMYSEMLKQNGINNVVINSDNKNEDEVLEEYNSIVKDSTINNIVVLCTSLINAGVNIKNDNVCVMVIQNRAQFDGDKVEQFFGRIRTDKHNTCILFLEQGEKHKYRSNKARYIDYYTKLAEMKALELNQYYFEKYGLEPIRSQMITDWNIYKSNEAYKEVSDIIYLDGDTFKVDHIAIHEKSRLQWLKNNYYDDEFISEIFKDLKTREFSITTLAPITELESDNNKLEEECNEITLKVAINNVINNVKAVREFELYARGTLKPRDFKEKESKVLYGNFKSNKDFRSMATELKSIVPKILLLDDPTPITTMLNVMLEYQAEQKKKERDENIKNIRRVEIYNKQFPLNTDVSVTGDIIYNIVRKNCDCFIGSRNCISKMAYKCMFDDYIRINQCTYKDNEWYDVKGKKIKPKTMKALLNNCILAIYNCSENLHLYSLK